MASLWCPASGSPSFYSGSFTQFFLGRRKSTAQVKPLHQEGGLCSLCLPSCFFKGVPKTRSVGAYTRRVFEALVEGSIAQDWR